MSEEIIQEGCQAPEDESNIRAELNIACMHYGVINIAHVHVYLLPVVYGDYLRLPEINANISKPTR